MKVIEQTVQMDHFRHYSNWLEGKQMERYVCDSQPGQFIEKVEEAIKKTNLTLAEQILADHPFVQTGKYVFCDWNQVDLEEGAFKVTDRCDETALYVQRMAMDTSNGKYTLLTGYANKNGMWYGGCGFKIMGRNSLVAEQDHYRIATVQQGNAPAELMFIRG